MKASALHATPRGVPLSPDPPSIASPPEPKREGNEKEEAKNQEVIPSPPDPPLTPEQREALASIARTYALDPALGEVVIAQGVPYIPLRGLLKLAHRAPRPLVGAELRPATAEERRASLVPEGSHYWRAALFQQGSSRPYVEWGLATPEEGLERGLSGRELADLAKSRAVARALRLGWPPEPGRQGAGETGASPGREG